MAMLQSWVERAAMQTKPFKTVAEKYSSNGVNKILYWRKGIYSGHTEKPRESPTARKCINQEEIRLEKNANRINVQTTVIDGISRRVTSGRENTSLILVDHVVQIIPGCYRKVMLL